MQHCSDNSADRALGAFWERQFCKLAARHGLVFSPMQLGKGDSATAFWLSGQKWNHLTLPDVTVWTAPGQHHEIKHKNPTRSGGFGLEAYRFHALLRFAKVTGQAVLYTIHNHDLSGGRDSAVNDLRHWLTADVRALDGKYTTAHNSSWVNGAKADGLSLYYWPTRLWQPLGDYWQGGHA